MLCVHLDATQMRGFLEHGIQRVGGITDQQRAARCTAGIQAAGMYQVDIEHQGVARSPGKLDAA